MKIGLSILALSALFSIGFLSFLAMNHGLLDHSSCLAAFAGRLQGSCAIPEDNTGEVVSHIGIFKNLSESSASFNIGAFLGLILFLAFFSLLAAILPGGLFIAPKGLTLRQLFSPIYFEKKEGHLISIQENSPNFLIRAVA